MPGILFIVSILFFHSFMFIYEILRDYHSRGLIVYSNSGLKSATFPTLAFPGYPVRLNSLTKDRRHQGRVIQGRQSSICRIQTVGVTSQKQPFKSKVTETRQNKSAVPGGKTLHGEFGKSIKKKMKCLLRVDAKRENKSTRWTNGTRYYLIGQLQCFRSHQEQATLVLLKVKLQDNRILHSFAFVDSRWGIPSSTTVMSGDFLTTS